MKATKLNHRKRIKKKKPTFVRQDAHKFKGLKKVWRKSKGIQSKMRLKKKGYLRSPSQGYRSPVSVRFLNAKGHKEVRVFNVKGLETVSEQESIIISSTVGMKKKIEILKEGLQKKLTFVMKDPKKTLANLESLAVENKKKRSALEKKKTEKEKKAEKKETKKEEPKSEEKSEKELKKEKDKVLTKRD